MFTFDIHRVYTGRTEGDIGVTDRITDRVPIREFFITYLLLLRVNFYEWSEADWGLNFTGL